MELSLFTVVVVVLVHAQLLSTVRCRTHFHVFNVEDVPYTRLCRTKSIMTVNGEFPGPTLYARRGDTIVVRVYNHANQNISIHWHGVNQPRNPWSDGPEYITQLPITPGCSFTYTLTLTTEEGTLWWHAHSDFSRATVHGAIVVRPKHGTTYPFPHPSEEYVLMLGEWWIEDVNKVMEMAVRTGGTVNQSDAFTINGQPGDLYPCSSPGTFRMPVAYGKTYLLRIVNTALSNGLFFAIANHGVVVVGSDGSYTKPLQADYIMVSAGETLDLLLYANQPPEALYYMAARSFTYLSLNETNNTTATGVLEYISDALMESDRPLLPLPPLPYYNDTMAAANFSFALRSLANADHPVDVPKTIDRNISMTIAINLLFCPKGACEGLHGMRVRASLNNVSFVTPPVPILGAYYRRIAGEFSGDFPDRPPHRYNYTADEQPLDLLGAELGTEAKVVEHGEGVELVFQGTSLVRGEDHPMHVHGHSFYVVGWGYGNFDEGKDPSSYNLEDPPLKNTVGVPRNGWVAIRFKASNPGVWFIHCHIERHMLWGMETVLIVKDGARPEEKMLPPPRCAVSCACCQNN